MLAKIKLDAILAWFVVMFSLYGFHRVLVTNYVNRVSVVEDNIIICPPSHIKVSCIQLVLEPDA